MVQDCAVCERINRIQKRQNPYFVMELPSGYVVIGDFQYYRGYTVFLSKIHASELHELSKAQRQQFLVDMALVAEAVYKAFQPRKLNYELLGNVDSHLHWHLFPRYADEPDPQNPVSATPASIRNADSARPSSAELKKLQHGLRAEIDTLLAN